ncbi:MAG: right-handed parallel beta-helix repeat-containing protein [bacterium]|nr:right-handed parallel beta-helix repeat-containing protein [bacterium]
MIRPVSPRDRLLLALRRCVTGLALLVQLVAVAAAAAGTLTVNDDGPADHSTIGAAIAAAATGDTIRVLPGLYTGAGNLNLDFGGKDLVLISQAGSTTTVIDGGGTGRAFWFHSGETAASLVRGFTVTGCTLSGPIRITDSSAPRILNCVVSGNQVTGGGGGIFIAGSSPAIRDCTIVENTTTDHGGGIVVSGGAPALTGLVVVGNRADGRGGGIWVTDGASATLTSCTVSANRAGAAGGAFAGGGVAVTGVTSAVIGRSIVWGNRATTTDDLLAATGATVQVNCSLVDSTGSGGTGAILRDGATQSVSPRFCAPDYGGASPWTDGEYTLAANSPAAPAQSACGQLLGALPVGCGDITVWTGGAGTENWADTDNWSTGAVPGPGDIVQLTRGNVFLDADAVVYALYQVSEDSAPDTLTIDGGAVFTLGTPAAFEKVEAVKTIRTDVVKVGDGEIFFPCTEPCPGSNVPPWVNGHWILDQATVRGTEVLVNLGEITVVPGGNVLFDISIENVAEPGLPGGEMLIQGVAIAAHDVLNAGNLLISATGSLSVAGMFTNAADGVVDLAGDLTGSGAFANLGTIQRVGPGVSQFDLAATNTRDLGQGQPGQIAVNGGTLQWLSMLDSQGLVSVAAGATLALDGIVNNGHAGIIDLTGNLAGSMSLENTGLIQRSGPGVSVISQPIVNALDPVTGASGTVLVSAGSAQMAGLLNAGTVTVASAATLQLTAPAVNGLTGVLSGGGLIDATGASLQNLGRLAPGLSPGILRINGPYSAALDSRLEIEIAGPVAGAGHDQLRLDSLAGLTGKLVVRVDDGFQFAVGDTFTIVRMAQPALMAAPTTVFACLAGTVVAGRPVLVPIVEADRVVLYASPAPPGHAAPLAADDSLTVSDAAPSALPVLANDSDPDGAPLTVAWLSTVPQHGRVVLDAAGIVLTYYPAGDGATADQFTYVVSDCAGAIDSAQVFISLADVSEAPPPLTVEAARLHPGQPNPFNPATRLRYELARPGTARLTIHDLRGGLVAVLSDGYHAAGVHEATWRGVDRRGRHAPSGAYFVRLEYGGGISTGKLLMLR